MKKDVIQANVLKEAVNAISSTQPEFTKEKSIVEEPVQVISLGFVYILDCNRERG